MKVIDVEDTPNPDALKFVLDSMLLEQGVRQYDRPSAAENDPLAAGLFALHGVMSVFYMGQFVTVTKHPTAKWKELQPAINQVVADKAHLVSGLNHAVTNGASKTADTEDALMADINRVLDENIRPALAGDGGGIEVLGLDGHVLTIHYQGACGSCPSASAGTMAAVQNLLQRMVDPRIKVVSA
jgi:NFU1 iron-sulfur cluster scaffold homolog, mitochondrial